MAGSPRYQQTIKQLVHKAYSPSITFLPIEAKKTTNSHIKLIFPKFRQSNRSDWYEVALASIEVIKQGLSSEPILIESTPIELVIETPYIKEENTLVSTEDMGTDSELEEEEIDETAWDEELRLHHQWYEDVHLFDEEDTIDFIGIKSEREYKGVPLEATAKRKWIHDNKMIDILSIVEIEHAIATEHETYNCFRQIKTIANAVNAIDPSGGVAMLQLNSQIIEPGNFKVKYDMGKFAEHGRNPQMRRSIAENFLIEWMNQNSFADDWYVVYSATIEETIQQYIAYRPHTDTWYVKSNPRDIRTGRLSFDVRREELTEIGDGNLTRPQVWFRLKDSITPYLAELEAIRDERIKKENYKGFAKVA
jgi:hypothetical protein